MFHVEIGDWLEKKMDPRVEAMATSASHLWNLVNSTTRQVTKLVEAGLGDLGTGGNSSPNWWRLDLENWAQGVTVHQTGGGWTWRIGHKG